MQGGKRMSALSMNKKRELEVFSKMLANTVWAFCLVAIIASCGGGTDNPTVTRFTIGGTVSGLAGSGLVLQNNAGDDLSISTDGAYAFATTVASGTAYAVTVKTQPIALSQTCTVSAGTGTVAAAAVSNVVVNCVTPPSRFAYVANYNDNDVSAYTIDATTGALTQITGSPFTAGTGPTSVAVDPSGKFAYAANATSNNVSAYTINATTGALTQITGSPFVAGTHPTSVAISR